MKWSWSAILIGLLAFPGCCLGHGLGWRHNEAPAQVLEFHYSNGEPLAYAQVIVRGPDQVIYQQAHTDQSGRFAFVPDRPGEWQVEADDGMGHGLRAEFGLTEKLNLAITRLDGQHPNGPLGLGRPLAVILGLSLIGNLLGGYYLWLSRRSA